MSALGAALGRALASLGGPTTAGAIVAGGLALGALGGGLAASGGGQTASAGGTLPVYACPDTGAPLATVQAGQRLLATGRTEDSAWLRIHYPEPGRTEAWVQASPLQVQGAVADLPVAACAPVLAALAPSFEPAPTLTTVEDNSPTPAPTSPPTASPTPSAVPNANPTLTALTASTARISYDTGDYCPNAETRVTFRVRAGDSAGVEGVALFWREPGADGYARVAMTRTGGSPTNGTWQVSLDTTASGITRAGRLAFYAVATDTDGATRRLPSRGAEDIAVEVCENTGPTIRNASSSSGGNLSWDPLFVGSCQTATNLTATVRDPQGVRSVTLFYRRPGDASWQSKAMNDETVDGKWYANLDTLGDKITIADPPTDPLRWYIRAVDGEGAASRTDTFSITIRRCDTEAEFDGVFPRNLNDLYPCTTGATIRIGTYANDEDQPGHGLRVVFHWELYNPRTQDGPITGKATATVSQGNYYEGLTKTFNGQRFYEGVLTVYAVTTDRYGGTTRSPTDTHRMSCD